MAKIILQASSFKRNYNIDTLAITAIEYKTNKTFALEVKPEIGFTVDAVDFYNGYLQDNIESVTYINTNEEVGFDNNVRVNIVLKGDITLKGAGNVIVFIPVNGVAKTPSNELTFIDETTQEEGINVNDLLGAVILRDSSILKNNHSNTYIATGVNGESGILMQKIFTAEQGFYLSNPPTWKLKSRMKSNYTITTKEFRDDNNDLIKKIYEISYVFPKNKFTAKYQDKIIFS